MAGFEFPGHHHHKGQQSLGDQAAQTANEVGNKLSHFGHEFWNKAKGFANAEHLDLAGQATKDTLIKLRDAVHLQSLDLSHNPFLNDRDLSSVLSRLPVLMNLDLGFNPRITDQGLAALQGNHNLRNLNLENTLINGAMLAFLPHAALISLVLRNDRNLHVQALNYLTRIPGLQRLDLSGNQQINDAALPVLRQLRQVKDLDLRGTNLSKRAVAELQREMPHTQIRH